MSINKKTFPPFLLVLAFVTLFIATAALYPGRSVLPKAANAVTFSSFSVGTGGTDVIPHQIVRTSNDRLYIFANQQSSKVIRVYRTTSTGLPSGTASFAAPVQLTETSEVIGIDAVYDGGSIIHVLVNMQNGSVKDYPFNTTTNTFSAATTIASNGGTVTSVLYVGTSGVAGMVDLNQTLHIAYWTNSNHILHRAYTYNSSTNVLSPSGNFVQVDTAGSANHPSVAISPVDNSLTVAWVSQADNPTKIRTRTRASSGTWGSIQSASTASVWTSSDNGINIDQGPSFIIDSTGVKHLAYIQSFDVTVGDYGRIHYVRDTGSGWTDQALSIFTHDPALALNSAGEIYVIGHGHPKNATCLSMDDMCTAKKNSNGTWGNPQLFAAHPSGKSFDSSPSVKWSVVGFNRPETIEFIFFMTPYDNPTLYYGRIQSSSATLPVISGNAGAPGVTLSYVDGTAKTVVSQGDGSYTITVPSGWSGTVTPSKAGYIFSPLNRSYSNVTTNQTAQNYIATFMYTISGNVGVGGVTLSYTDGGAKTVTSKGDGSYTITVPGGWSGTVTPTSTCHTFAPLNLSYSNLGANTSGQNYTSTFNTSIGCSNINVTIGGNTQGNYGIGTGQRLTDRYGINGGPVRVRSTNGVNMFTSQRAIYGSSFNSIVGFPADQLTTEYWFTSLDDAGMITYLVIGNPSATETALVDVYIGGVKKNTTPYSIPPGQRVYPRYGVNGGPVRVVSTNGVNIFTSERSKYGNSFNEVMGFPSTQLDTEFWFTSYDDAGMITYLVIGNPSETETAEVDVYIGGVKKNTTPYSILPGQRVFLGMGSMEDQYEW
ncbi:MAG: hypothetical protein IPP66_03645 [Anaerolineales bacterium]|nr:hypothetical protein [Anaerolineales bacterium]